MYSTAAAPAPVSAGVRYLDHLAQHWFDTHAPCRWQGNVSLLFSSIEFASLAPAGSWKHPDLVEKWVARIRNGRAIPPLIVCPTGHGTWYLHDGNHRHEALEQLLGPGSNEFARVAELVPHPGYFFRFVKFREYGTYVLFRDERLMKRDSCLASEAAWLNTGAATL